MSTPVPPAELVERGLAASTTAGCVVIAEAGATLNLRWANNTLTTNGLTHSGQVTVIAVDESSGEPRTAAITRSGVDASSIASLVADAEAAAKDSVVADDAAPLVAGPSDSTFGDEPADVPVSGLAGVAEWLGEVFAAAKSVDQARFGYAEHDVSTTYVGTSAGLRRRHVQPAVRLEVTGRSTDGQRSAWAGQAADDVARLDLAGIEHDLTTRLEWAKRQQSLDAGRYDTVLPPSAVADLMTYMFWSMGSLDAHEGSTVFSKAGGGTKVGQSLSSLPVTLRSDPAMEGQRCMPFVAAPASSRMSSVFDNGMPLEATDWISGGTREAVGESLASAGRSVKAWTARHPSTGEPSEGAH